MTYQFFLFCGFLNSYCLFVKFSADIFRRRFHRVFSGKAALADAELTAHQFFQSLDLQIVQTVCTDEVTDLLHGTVICDQLVSRRNICAEIAGPQKRRLADSHMDFLRSCFPQHLHDTVGGGAADNGIIDHNDTFSIDRLF